MRLSKTKIQEQMSVQGITQIDLAKLLDISPRQVNRWMTRSAAIPKKYYSKIAKALKIESEELLDKRSSL